MGATPIKNRPEYRGPDPRCISIVQDLAAAIRALAEDKTKGERGEKTLLLLAEAVSPAIDWLWAPRTITITNVSEDMVKILKRDRKR